MPTRGPKRFYQPIGSFAPVSGGGAAAMSVVLSKASNQYLTWTPHSSPTNDQKATFSFWMKATSLPTLVDYMYDGGGSPFTAIRYTVFSPDRIEVITHDGGGDHAYQSNGDITDTGVWHHICIALDSTQSAEGDRTTVWIDGSLKTAADTSTLAQNGHYAWAVDSQPANIGTVFFNPTVSIDARFAYFYFIDGQAKTVTDFVSGSGVGTTTPIAYGGTFGANGFFLNFSGSALTDQSGNGNDWTGVNSPTFSSDIP